MLGQVYNPHQQCQLFLGNDSYFAAVRMSMTMSNLDYIRVASHLILFEEIEGTITSSLRAPQNARKH
jgi:hypothetical protein